MPTFLSDPVPSLYLILAAFVVVAAVLAARSQDRRSLIRVGIALVPLVVLYLCDKLVESPREEAVRRTLLIEKAADTADRDAFVAQVADQVEFKTAAGTRALQKDEIRNHTFWNQLKANDVRVRMLDFSRDEVKNLGPDAVEIGFVARGDVRDSTFPFYLRATYTRQADGQRRLTGLSFYNYVNRGQLETIPGFP